MSPPLLFLMLGLRFVLVYTGVLGCRNFMLGKMNVERRLALRALVGSRERGRRGAGMYLQPPRTLCTGNLSFVTAALDFGPACSVFRWTLSS